MLEDSWFRSLLSREKRIKKKTFAGFVPKPLCTTAMRAQPENMEPFAKRVVSVVHGIALSGCFDDSYNLAPANDFEGECQLDEEDT